MQITLFSFFSSVLWSSVLIVGIYVLRKARHFRTSFGLGALVLLYLFSIMRLLFPLELPHVIELGIDNDDFRVLLHLLVESCSLSAEI